MIPKKKSRKIIVDDVEYYWMLSKPRISYKKEGDIENINLYVQKQDNSQLLKVPLNGKYVDKRYEYRICNSEKPIYKPALLPSDVKTLIVEARNAGWMENKDKKIFILNKNLTLSEYWVKEKDD